MNIVTADPFWTAEIYDKRTGEDFLAIRAVQESLTGFLLPGVITITPRARYYSFYCWLFQEYFEAHPVSWDIRRFIRRREQIFGLANVVHEDVRGEQITGLVGVNKFRKHRAVYGEKTICPLTLDHYLSYGKTGYSENYAGVMRNLQLVQYDDDHKRYELLPQGVRLANAYAKSIDGTSYYRDRHRYDESDEIPMAVLVEYGEVCHLDNLHDTPEALAISEALFALDEPNPLSISDNSLGNMKSTLGVILDVARQHSGLVDDARFRKAICYSNCPDYPVYQPDPALAPILTHWRMFALRDQYIYVLYALWTLLLGWLEREDGPRPLSDFDTWLEKKVDLAEPAAAVDLTLPRRPLSEWRLHDLLDMIAEQNGVPAGDLETLGKVLSNRYSMKPNEYKALELITPGNIDSPGNYVGGCWFLLISLALRIAGLTHEAPATDWVSQGGWDRRAMSCFVKRFHAAYTQNLTVGEVWGFLFREFVVAQHIRASLQKWEQREANTFHFTVENGLFEFRRHGRTDWTASRFKQAYQVLTDLGLLSNETGAVESPLTPEGERMLVDTLERLQGDV